VVKLLIVEIVCFSAPLLIHPSPLYATFNWYQSQTFRQELNRLERLCRRLGIVWMRSLLRPRAMLLLERPPPLMELQGTPVWSNSRLSSSNSNSKERLTSSRRSQGQERKIRDPTTLLPLTMIIYLPIAPSLWYPLVNPPFRLDGLYQMKILDEDASNLTQSERLDYCAHMY
jgi:hypothetical protein